MRAGQRQHRSDGLLVGGVVATFACCAIGSVVIASVVATALGGRLGSLCAAALGSVVAVALRQRHRTRGC